MMVVMHFLMTGFGVFGNGLLICRPHMTVGLLLMLMLGHDADKIVVCWVFSRELMQDLDYTLWVKLQCCPVAELP